MLATLAVRSFGLLGVRFFSSIVKCMERHGVVPDVVTVAPYNIAEVRYPCAIIVDLGNVLTPRQVKDVPTVIWNSDQNCLYTLCMTDPDAPSRCEPTSREWHHWLVGNIPGRYLQNGEVLSAYIGAGPPKDTGLHRYVFLIYKQKCEVQFDEEYLCNSSAGGRDGFSIKKFALKYELGRPVAGNLFLAEWDDYVPQLYKKLGL